jgi:hypothetical protein
VGIHKDDRFEEQLKTLRTGFSRLDDAISSVEYLLSEYPDSGIRTSVPGIYVFRTRLPDDGKLARFAIFYLYDGKDVRFVDLQRAP